MKISDYIVRTNLYVGADKQIYNASLEFKNDLVTLFVFPKPFEPKSPGLKVLSTFQWGQKFVVVTENVQMTMEQYIKDTKDQPRNTQIAILFKDILTQLPFNSFSPTNVFVQTARNGAIRARLGLNIEQESFFASPEGGATMESAIWSAGVMLFYMITGRSPYNGANEETLESRIKMFQLDPIPPLTDPTFKEILADMLRLEPERRQKPQAIMSKTQFRTKIPPRTDW